MCCRNNGRLQDIGQKGSFKPIKDAVMVIIVLLQCLFRLISKQNYIFQIQKATIPYFFCIYFALSPYSLPFSSHSGLN